MPKSAKENRAMKMQSRYRTVGISNARAREYAEELLGAGWQIVAVGKVTATLERGKIEGMVRV